MAVDGIGVPDHKTDWQHRSSVLDHLDIWHAYGDCHPADLCRVQVHVDGLRQIHLLRRQHAD